MNAIAKQPPQQARSQIELHLKKSKRLLHEWADNYNAQFTRKEDRKHRLKGTHLKLAEHLMQLYYGLLRGQQGSAVLNLSQPEAELPTLRTSNGALAKEFKVTKETIINWRKRLTAAKIITGVAWHGTNAAYELHINARVLFLRDRAGSWHGNLNALFLGPQTKFFDYTVSGTLYPEYPDQDTKKRRNKSGEAAANHVENSADSAGNAAASSANERQDTGSGYNAGVTDSGTTKPDNTQDTSPPGLRAAPPKLPEVLPRTLDEAIGWLPETPRKAVVHIAAQALAKALQTVYRQETIQDSQREMGVIALAEYVARSVHPSQYDRALKDIYLRLRQATRYYDRKGGRFRLLPEWYFDLRNRDKGGFAFTEKWSAKHHRETRRRNREKAIDFALTIYLRALKSPDGEKRKLVYHQETQKLRKSYGARAVAEFEELLDSTILNMRS